MAYIDGVEFDGELYGLRDQETLQLTEHVLKRTVNLYDRTTKEVGEISQTGAVVSSGFASVSTSGFIPIEGGETYKVAFCTSTAVSEQKRVNYYAFYDAGKDFISPRGTGVANLTFTAPTEARYVRFSCNQTYADGMVLTKESEFPTSYIPYAEFSDEFVEEVESLANQFPEGAIKVATEAELTTAVGTDGNTIVLADDITLAGTLTITHSVNIYGNDHTINCGYVSGTSAGIQVQDCCVRMYNMTVWNGKGCVIRAGFSGTVSGSQVTYGGMLIAKNCHIWRGDDVVEVHGYGVGVFVDCDIHTTNSTSTPGTSGGSTYDAVNVHQYGRVYLNRCKIHEAYDEGISTHDHSYAEVINTEAYNCGYLISFNSTYVALAQKGAYSSYGGIHLGGTGMGIVKGCYSHDNATYGIGLYCLDPEHSTGKAICVGNVVKHNGYVNNVAGDADKTGGIIVYGARDLELRSNTAIENANYGIRFGVDPTGTSYTAHPASSGFYAENLILNNGIDTNRKPQIDAGADGGLYDGTIFDVLDEKADVDGNYPDMSVGQLLSESGTANPTPYTHRANTSGSDRVTISQITGGTVAFNQIQPNSSTRTNNGVNFTYDNGALTVSGTATANATWLPSTAPKTQIVAGHKYLCSAGNPKYVYPAVTDGGIQFYLGNITSGKLLTNDSIFTFEESSEMYLQCLVPNGIEASGVYHPQIFDLTQMFGSAVADYIYGLETATLGAGTAIFRQMFPNLYYANNSGTLISVQTAGRKTIGFNLWDEEWEVGSIRADTGENQSSTTAIRSKNYIPVIPGSVLYMKVGSMTSGTAVARWYDYSHNYLGNLSINLKVAGSQTVPNGACYVRFITQSAWSYGTTYKHDICINIYDPSRNGTYEPYSSQTYPLDSTLTLRGVPVLSGGVPAYDGDKYAPDGTVTRRYGIVDLGTLTWSRGQIANSENYRFAATVTGIKGSTTNYLISGGLYTQVTATSGLAGADMTSLCGSNGFYLRNDAYSTGEDFKTAMSGVYLVYELATPTTETADPYQSIQIAGSTEAFLPPETDTRPAAVPVGSVSLYQTNLRAGLETLLDTDLAHAESIAPVQGSTASANIASGELLMRDGKLYTATQAIVAGAEISSTNTTETTLAAQLAALEARIAALEN